jgi:hypothetical protein
MAQAVSFWPVTVEAAPAQSMWDWWWIKWHRDRFSPEYFSFPQSILFHQCSIAQKNKKTLIVIITGLHNKLQGCSTSVVSAAGPFTTKKKKTPYYMLCV